MKFPQTLIKEDIFKCPIWLARDVPEHTLLLNKASNSYIDAAKKKFKKTIDGRNKTFGNKKDMGFVYHSTSLLEDPKFKSLQNYAGSTASNLLNEMGFDLKNHNVFMTEMWVQKKTKNGGGHHSLHTHWNGHISGFYFLKGSEKTSMPVFEDPRPGNLMNLLPELDKNKNTYASSQVQYKPTPGTMIFFPSYMPHQYVVDMGYEPFRFIHFNCQAIPKGAANVVKKK